MAIVVAMAGIFVNFLSIGAYPVWSIIAIVGQRTRPVGRHRPLGGVRRMNRSTLPIPDQRRAGLVTYHAARAA